MVRAARVELTYTRVSDMVGGEPTEKVEREGEEFAKGHYEQLVAATGTIAVGDQEWAVQGFGLRDHSWGPRTWQAPWYYRWLTANFGGDFGFMGSRIARPDRDGHARRVHLGRRADHPLPAASRSAPTGPRPAPTTGPSRRCCTTTTARWTSRARC